jgi:hypothetical protein
MVVEPAPPPESEAQQHEEHPATQHEEEREAMHAQSPPPPPLRNSIKSTSVKPVNIADDVDNDLDGMLALETGSTAETTGKAMVPVKRRIVYAGSEVGTNGKRRKHVKGAQPRKGSMAKSIVNALRK